MWTPDAIAKLQHSARANRFETYKEYAQIINDQSHRLMTLRGLFEFNIDPAKSIPLEQVEPAAEIVKRFATGAMSLGSISTEAHATLAVAMNRIGGKSKHRRRRRGSGALSQREWRASDRRRHSLQRHHRQGRHRRRLSVEGGDSLRSKIKQVASGRFGVTNRVPGVRRSVADQDGARAPSRRGRSAARRQGERVHRQATHSVPGVGLISPPPHHDIYSIEDLAQA
jgi:glutamate synthase domain-containing protein 2